MNVYEQTRGCKNFPIFKQVLIEEKSHRFNRNSPFVVKIKYIYHNTNVHLI